MRWPHLPLLRTMSLRIFLIVVVGIFLTATLVNLMGLRDLNENEHRLQAQFTYDRIENVLRILDATLPEKRLEIQDVFGRMGSRVQLNVTKPATIAPLPNALLDLHGKLVPELVDAVTLTQACDLPPWQAFKRARQARKMFQREREKPTCLMVYAHLDDQTPVLIQLHYGHRPPPRLLHRQPYTLPLLALGLIAITWLVALVATKPLRKLGDAALQLAKNIDHPPLSEHEGPIEVRKAAQAFNTMQRSIVRHLQARSFMLGAIAHDLQTPLTRLRLRLEKVKDPTLKQQLIADLTATQEMVKQGLDFARLSGEHLDTTPLDLTALIHAIVDDMLALGHHLPCQIPEKTVHIMGSPHLLKRCLTNVLDNAFNYGQAVSLQIHQTYDWVTCTISDQGPGIPEAELEHMLEPFQRMEDSRSRQTGGTGLGLAIARMIAEKHGGHLHLANQPLPLTGLVVTIRLPTHGINQA